MHITQLFCTSFAILSIFPLLAFVGFAICAGSIILATSLVFLIGWLAVIIGSAGEHVHPVQNYIFLLDIPLVYSHRTCSCSFHHNRY